MARQLIGRRTFLATAALVGLAVLGACGAASSADGEAGDGETVRSSATGRVLPKNTVLTEADAGQPIEVARYIYDIGLPDKKGLEIRLTGDDASTLRWRFVDKPDPLLMEWHAVDGAPAFETDGLLGNPTSASKLLEFRATGVGEGVLAFELVEQAPSGPKRTGPPAKRLEFPFKAFWQDDGTIREAVPCYAGYGSCR